MTTNALTKPDLSPEPTSLAGLLRLPQYAKRFEEVLKNNSPQFISSIMQVGRALGPDCEPKSIIGSAMIAAALNLPIDKNLGFAWIVPYKNKGQKMAQFQMGYKGYVQLALRTGQYSRLNVCEIYEGELQGLDKLTGDLTIDPSKKTSDKVIGYASYLRLVSGFEHAEYWSVDTVKAHAQRYSQSYRGGFDSPWKTHFDEMAKKTVLSMHIRRWGPMSVDVHKAHQADSAVVMDIDAEPTYVDNSDVEVKEEKPQLESPAAENKPAVVEPAKPATKSGADQTETLASSHLLLNKLTEIGVEPDIFTHYINVNALDKPFGFDAASMPSIYDWPAAACYAFLADTAMLARIQKRLGKK